MTDARHIARAAWGVLALLAGAAAAGPYVETIDAVRIDGEIKALSADGVTIASAGSERKIALADVAEVVFAPPGDATDADPMARPGQIVLITAAGDVLPVEELSLAAEKWHARGETLGIFELPIGAAAVVYLPGRGIPPRQVEQQCGEFKLAERTRDVMIVAKDKGGLLAVEGVLKAVSDETVAFTWQDSERTISRDKVRAIRLAATPSKAASPAGVLAGGDGTTVAFTSAALAPDGAVVVDLPSVGRKSVPRRAVQALRFRSDRVVDLDDLKPASVKEYGFFDKTFPHRVGSAVGGGPIALGGQAYPRGLSMHSFCEMTYELNGSYGTFVALAGIDDAVRPAGDAKVTFLADDKELSSLRLTGRDKPQLVRLNVSGARRFTLRVEFGDDGLDVGDHVNLALARFVK